MTLQFKIRTLDFHSNNHGELPCWVANLKNMLPNEFDSQNGEVYKKLKTAKDYGYNKQPCDICEKTDQEVRFWGGSSVLICGRSSCLNVMEEEVPV